MNLTHIIHENLNRASTYLFLGTFQAYLTFSMWKLVITDFLEGYITDTKCENDKVRDIQWVFLELNRFLGLVFWKIKFNLRKTTINIRVVDHVIFTIHWCSLLLFVMFTFRCIFPECPWGRGHRLCKMVKFISQNNVHLNNYWQIIEFHHVDSRQTIDGSCL